MFCELKDDVFFFSKLPIDMWYEIFQFLNPLDIFCNAVNVCKNWRCNLLNFYLKNYLINNLNFLNIESTDKFINELFNNEELFTKFKKYLFNQQVYNLSTQLQQNQIIIDNNKNYLFKENIQRNINDLSNYFYLINHNKYIFAGEDSENKINNTSCFGNVFSFSNTNNNNNDIHVNNNNNSKKITIFPQYYNKFKGNTNNFKSVLVGYSGVGKTCFVQASINKTFDDNNGITIGAAFAIKQHCLDDLTFKMEIWDTAGPERYQSLAPMFYRYSSILFVCFDLTNMDSFKSVRKWKEEIEKSLRNGMLYEIILLGFKSDLKERRVVMKEEAERLAFELEVMYFEVSSKLMENVDTPTWHAVLLKYCIDKFLKRMGN